MLQPFVTILVLGILAGMIGFGFYYGLFLSLVTGLGALASVIFVLGFTELLANILIAVEVPSEYAFPASFLLLSIGAGLLVHWGIHSAIGEETLRFSKLVDRVGGALVGGFAGTLIAGLCLVVFSALPVPDMFRIDGTQTDYDFGTQVLKIFARLIEPNETKRKILLFGETPTADVTTGGTVCSELFVDKNRNALFDVDQEPMERYLDSDGNGNFTERLNFIDENQNANRDVGLLERYAMGAWGAVQVMHFPTIQSPSLIEHNVILSDAQPVYLTEVIDLTVNDAFVFSLEGPDSALFSIDPTTGVVTVKDADEFMRRTEPSQITIVVTDSQQLRSEKPVTLLYRGVVPGQ
ncbi:MAG: CvpA family protein [Pirellulales bacterium]